MDAAQTRMIESLASCLAPGTIVTDQELIAPWLTDWRGRYHGAVAALLQPRVTDDVAAIVRAAAAHRVPLVPQGGNTSMVGGATPPEDGGAMILSLRRMDRIRRLDTGAGPAIVEAGVILQRLQEAAAEAGMRFPLTLGARGSATMGGLVSTNAGGTQVLRFGTMRALVMGVEAVMADGSVHDGLAALRKDNRGYDLDQLLVGAEGTLGIITAAALQLVPAVAARGTAWAGLSDPQAALDLLRRMQASAEGLESFEILPQGSLDAVVAHVPGSRAPLAGQHPWHALIEITAPNSATEAPSLTLERLLRAALEQGLIADAVIASSEAQAQDFWTIRDSISDSERALGPASQHDIAVPVEAMPRFMVEAARACEARFPGTTASGFGHLGDGNVHFHVRAAPCTDSDDWYAAQVPVVSAFVHDLVTAAGGTISAEHGIGQMKRDELVRLASPARMAALTAIKRALDPLGILNPGKLLALAPGDPAP